jgi:hypothetical protein
MVARARRPRFRDFFGVGDIDPGYDPKAASPEEFGKYRVASTGAPARPASRCASRTPA